MRPVVRPVVCDVVYDVDSYCCAVDDVVSLTLNNTADTETFLTKYGGSYTRASSMYVPDYQGVYHENTTNVIPYHGARWTGTEWVNTDASGNALTNEIGVAFWPSTTNVIASGVYRDFTNAAWTKTNGSISAGDVVLIDGTTVADKNTFTASANNATILHSVYTSPSGTHAGGFFVKRKTGTGIIRITVDGGPTWVDVTSQIDADDMWHLVQTYGASVTNPQIGLNLATSGDEVYLDWAQLDVGFPYVSVYPITGGSTIANSRFKLIGSGNVPKLIKDSKGSIYTEQRMLPANYNMNNPRIAYMNSLGQFLYIDGSPVTLRSFEGTHVRSVSGLDLSVYSKSVCYWSGSTNAITANGSNTDSGSYDGTWQVGNFYLGSQEAVNSWYGFISKIIFSKNPHDQTYWETETTQGCSIPIGYDQLVDANGDDIVDENGDCVYGRNS